MPVEIRLQAGASSAYNGFDLDPWLAWPTLARFSSVGADQAFARTPGLETLLASPHLSPTLEELGLSYCDLGLPACKLLGKSPRLTRLRRLHLDRGDYDRSSFDGKCLDALFPKKGGTLRELEYLSIRGAKGVTSAQLEELVSTGRAPALREVLLSWQGPPVTLPRP